MDIFNNPKKLKKLKGFSDLMLEFNVEKYNLFKEMSEKYGWDNVYTQDIRYDLIRMVIMDCHIKKGFFTISDLTGVTDLNIRSIERFLSKSVAVGYLEKKPGKDKRVVEYHATEKSTHLLKTYLKLTKKGAELFHLDSEDTAELSNLSPKELKDFLDWSEDKI
jgi:DNA-binding MarR family transcriptional regulator